MKSIADLKETSTVKIYITIKDKSTTKIVSNKVTFKMDKETRKRQSQRLCSICLNDRPQDSTKTCPICRDNYETSIIHGDIAFKHETGNTKMNSKGNNTKNVQTSTSQADINHGLTLLKEVLSVFQNKRLLEENKAIDNQTPKFKDASVNTDEKRCRSSENLSLSKIFHHSIESQSNTDGNYGNFIIVSSKQPDILFSSQYSINLTKQKSSSIPRMKLEELKYSLKEKTKSKDAIEEVNRMFATVKKYAEDDAEKINRPLIRHGPQVLPVVKAKHQCADRKDHSCGQNTERMKHYCTLNNMCGGDSAIANKHCHKEGEKPKAPVTVCCCYKNHACEFKDVKICRCCLKSAQPMCNCDEKADSNRRSAYTSYTGF